MTTMEQGAQSHAAEALGALPRWPRVVGTIGIIVGVIMFIDHLDDLVIALMWSEDDWSRMLGSEIADLVVRVMPSTAWLVPFALAGMVLAVLLLTGSIRLRRRCRSGVTICRTWSWMAIAFAAIETTQGIWWLGRHGDEIPGFAEAGSAVGGIVAFSLVMALAVLLVYPVFLLVWFTRPQVREEYFKWAEQR